MTGSAAENVGAPPGSGWGRLVVTMLLGPNDSERGRCDENRRYDKECEGCGQLSEGFCTKGANTSVGAEKDGGSTVQHRTTSEAGVLCPDEGFESSDAVREENVSRPTLMTR